MMELPSPTLPKSAADDSWTVLWPAPIKDHDNLDSMQVGKKRRKTISVSGTLTGTDGLPKTKQMRGRKGKLRHLPEMPLDILFEIFGNLNPLDVLHLARTTKSLRGILMHRSATSIWREARSNVPGLPERPSDLTEAQYANLAFNSYCHYCFAPNVQTILWSCRVRCCKKCMTHQFVTKAELRHLSFTPQFPDLSLILSWITMPARPYARWTTERFSISQAEELFAEFCKIKDDKEKLDQWITDRNKLMIEQNYHADLCKIWHREFMESRSCALGDARCRRGEVIVQKLTALGWGEELAILMQHDPASFRNHPLVRQSKDLTDRMWSNIEATMVKFFEEVKERRLEREKNNRRKLLVNVLADYVKSRPVDEVTPRAADVYYMANAKNVIDKTPVEVEVNAGSFAELLLQLPRLSEEWRQSKNVKLMTFVNMHRRHHPGIAEALNLDLTPLELATTYFKCSFCPEPISYPRILAHNCMTNVHPRYFSYISPYQREFMSLDSRPWNQEGSLVSLTFHTRAHNCARWVIEACGFDPDLITAREMDEAEPMLYCRHCDPETGFRNVMGWRKAVIDMTIRHVDQDEFTHPPLVRVADNLKLIVKDEGKKQLDVCPDLWGSNFCCVQCRKRLDWTTLKEHISESHHVAMDDIQERDYYFHIDASTDMPPMPVLIWS